MKSCLLCICVCNIWIEIAWWKTSLSLSLSQSWKTDPDSETSGSILQMANKQQQVWQKYIFDQCGQDNQLWNQLYNCSWIWTEVNFVSSPMSKALSNNYQKTIWVLSVKNKSEHYLSKTILSTIFRQKTIWVLSVKNYWIFVVSLLPARSKSLKC